MVHISELNLHEKRNRVSHGCPSELSIQYFSSLAIKKHLFGVKNGGSKPKGHSTTEKEEIGVVLKSDEQDLR